MFFTFKNFFTYDLFYVDIISTYTDKIWLIYSNIISLFLIIMFIILLGIILATNAKHVKFLNLTSAFYLIIFLFFNSLNYSYDFINLNWSFNQNTSLFVNLFIFISTITVILFFLGISNIFFIEENSKIEFTFLIWFIYVSAIYLISSTDFISIIILLECIAFSSYVLVGFDRKNKFSTTSALKYLILASIPSGFFILGIALLYNNFGTFSQDYLNLLFNISNNFEFKIENFKVSSKTIVELQNEIFEEFFFYVDYLNNVYSVWTPDLAILLEKLFYEYKHEVYLLGKNFDKEQFFLKHKDHLGSNISEYDITKAIYAYFETNTVLESQEQQAMMKGLLTFYPYIIHELRFLKFFWENICLFNEVYVPVTFTLKHNNELYAFLREFDYKNILNWFQFFAKQEFLAFTFTANQNIIFNNDYTLFNNLGTSGGTTFNQHNTLLQSRWTISKDNINDFYTISLEIIHYLDLMHIKVILLANEYVYLVNQINSVEFNIKNHIPFVENIAWGTSVFIDNLELFYHNYFKMSIKSFFKLSDFPHSSVFEPMFEKLDLFNVFDREFDKGNPEFFTKYSDYSHMEEIKNFFNTTYFMNNLLSIYLVLLFILMNLCFKLTAAPFHVWAPSVYGGSPLATLTFLSIFSKLTIFFFTIWLFLNIFDSLKNIWQSIMLLISFLSVICSILGAFSEKIFKRFFVYSSIGHVGFMLIGITVLNLDGIKSTIDYLILYILSSFLIWFILLHLSKKTTMLVNLKGLSFNQPILSLIFSITIFSLSGIPPFGGFFVKYEIFYSMINSSLFYFAYILLLLTVISFFYYLRLIKIIFFEQNKIFIKNKNVNDIKLRIIAFCFFIIPLFMLFFENPTAYFLKNILYTSLI